MLTLSGKGAVLPSSSCPAALLALNPPLSSPIFLLFTFLPFSSFFSKSVSFSDITITCNFFRFSLTSKFSSCSAFNFFVANLVLGLGLSHSAATATAAASRAIAARVFTQLPPGEAAAANVVAARPRRTPFRSSGIGQSQSPCNSNKTLVAVLSL